MTTLKGPVLFGTLKEVASFPWKDDNGQTKNLESFKVLVPHTDGTISMESISFPANYHAAGLVVGRDYGFPVQYRWSKKSNRLNWTAHPTMMPFPSPEVE